MQRILILIALMLGLAAPAAAHGPPRLKTSAEVLLDATPEEVWAVIGNFGDMSWHPAVHATEGGSNEVGAIRVLSFDAAGAAQLSEELTRYDATARTYSYRIAQDVPQVLPVTNYAAHLTVKDQDGKALVEWRGAFYRGHPNNNPPADLNDDRAIEAVDAVYLEGLEALVARFGRMN
ncbi:SRPBCC family protein [Plastorhodobacter daqingensis]|uniref:SRPBCC family protein n=1 Tax=Plastorhodobacter daqingensis TaxID=1387281 RepID=A0ABW2UHJ5_9RHOB